jgi:hypothetical protein
MIPKRVSLVPIVGIPFTSSKAVNETYVAFDVIGPLKTLAEKVSQAGGTLKLNSVFRSWDKQQELRDKYEAYEKLVPEEKKKVPFVPLAAFPGGSFHMAGRAIDVSLKDLNFKGVAYKDQLKKFWDIAIPIGFRPINDQPTMDVSEAWHFDYCGVWDKVRTKYSYNLAAKCAIIDIGNWNPKESENKIKNMFIQAQLLRLGHDIGGTVDGILGLKSTAALTKEKLEKQSIDNIIMALVQR